MFQKILVALDTTTHGARVFAEALELAKRVQGSLMIVHVISPTEEGGASLPPVGMGYYPSFSDDLLLIYRKHWETYEKECLELLNTLSLEASSVGVTAEMRQTYGDPGTSICDLAKQWGAELIVTGRRGFVGVSEWLSGSVSSYVLHHAPCSVLVVQGTLPLAPTQEESLKTQPDPVKS